MTGRTWFWAFFPFEIYHCKENGILPGKPERSPQVQYCSPATRPTLLPRPLLALSEPRTLLAWRWEVERRWVIQSRIHCQRKFTFNNQFIVLRKSFCVCVQTTQWMWLFCLSRNLVWHWNVVILNFASWPMNSLCVTAMLYSFLWFSLIHILWVASLKSLLTYAIQHLLLLIFLHETMSQSLYRFVSCFWILFNLSEWMASSNWRWWEDRGCIQCDSYLLHRENTFVLLFREMGLYIFIALEAQLSHILTRHYAEMLSLAIVCSAFILMLHLLCARWQEMYQVCVYFLML